MLMKIVSLSPFVKVKFILNMFIGLWFLIVLCQCDQVNEKAKNYGEKFDVSVACNGNPCQNGGKCTPKSQADDTQVGFVNYF